LSEYVQFAGAMVVAMPGWGERVGISKDGRA
jgi:hypothetical protein